MAARRVKQNPLSDAVEWWDTVDYGRNRRPVEELYFAPAPASNDKVLSHLYPSFSHHLVRRWLAREAKPEEG